MTPPPDAAPAHLHEPSSGPVDPANWFLPARYIVAIALIILPGGAWVWKSNNEMATVKALLVKIDAQMVVPSQFNEWGYEFKAANPTSNLTVPRLPKKYADQYHGD